MSAGDWKDMFKGVQENDYELVRYYLKIGIDPNYQHPEFMALPLAESLRYNHLGIAKLLLENGANPLVKEIESNGTCIDLAYKMNNQSVIDLLKNFVETSD